MIFSRKLLQLMGFISDSREEVRIETTDTIQVIEEEIQQDVAEMATMNVDSDGYNKAADSVEKLCDGASKLNKSISERKKIELEILEAQKRKLIDWSQLVPKLVAIGVYGLVAMFWLCLERQTPVSMRMLKLTDTLLTPKSI